MTRLPSTAGPAPSFSSEELGGGINVAPAD